MISPNTRINWALGLFCACNIPIQSCVVLLKPVPIGTLVGTRNACAQKTCTQKGYTNAQVSHPID